MSRFQGPGPGEPVSRTDLREVASGLSNLYNRTGLVGVNCDETGPEPLLSVPQPQRCNARILDGDNPYSWEEVAQSIADDGSVDWIASGSRGGTLDTMALYERNDRDDVAAGTIVEALLDESTGNWLFTRPPTDELFDMTLTSRSGNDYGWKFDAAGSNTGTIPVAYPLVHTQTADGVLHDIYILSFLADNGLTSITGTYTLTEAGGSPTAAIAPTAAASVVGALLSHFSVTGATLGLPPLTFTATTISATPLVLDGSLLGPSVSHNPATFRESGTAMAVPVKVRAKQISGARPSVKVATKQAANGTTKHAVFTLTRKNLIDGQYRFWFDGDGSGSEGAGTNGWVRIDWNESAADMATAMSTLSTCTVTEPSTDVFEITVTADYANHEPGVDITDTGLGVGRGLIGTIKYGVVWSDGTPCTGPIGGVDPASLLAGNNIGLGTSSVTITRLSTGNHPTDTIHDSWQVTVRNSTCNVVFDGGASAGGGSIAVAVNNGTGSPASPLTTSGSGFSISALIQGAKGGDFVQFTVTVTADFATGHTLVASNRKQNLQDMRIVIVGNSSDNLNQCVGLAPPGDLPFVSSEPAAWGTFAIGGQTFVNNALTVFQALDSLKDDIAAIKAFVGMP